MPVVEKSADTIEVFISYSHKDEDLRKELDNHLSALRRTKDITDWHDRRIGAGQEWAGEIDANLNSADIILLLISSDFLASKYCYEIEMQRAMSRHDAGEARVIPVILRAVDWAGVPFEKLQALPRDGKPVVTWSTKDEGFADVARGIREVVKALRTGGVSALPAAEPRLSAPVTPPERSSSVTAQSVSKGIVALIDLIGKDPSLRVEVSKFQDDFEVLRAQICVMGDYKTLHDLLHELQLNCYKPIVDEASRFPEDRARENLSEYELRLDDLLQRSEEVTARPTFTKEQILWVQHLKQARQELVEAIELPDAGKLKSAIKLMKGVLAKQPSKLDARLNTLASQLRLVNIVSVMAMLHQMMANLTLDPEKVKTFQTGADGMERLNQVLQELIKKHNQWQDADDELRRIEDFLEQGDNGVDELVDSWPTLKLLIQPLLDEARDARAQTFKLDGEKLEAAIAAHDPFKIKQSFRRFRGQANARFYEVDDTLKRTCDELRLIGEPLALMLQVIQ
jgi:hypothetical protein